MPLCRVLLVLAGLIGLPNCAAEGPPMDSQVHQPGKPDNLKALAAYQEGMKLIGTNRWTKIPAAKLERAEKFFQEAATYELPEAYYGLACAAYRSGDINRASQAFAFAEHAAELGVLEAEGLLVSYYSKSYGTTENNEGWAEATRKFDTSRDRLVGKPRRDAIFLVTLPLCGPVGERYYEKGEYVKAPPRPFRKLMHDLGRHLP